MLKFLERLQDKAKGNEFEFSTNKIIISCCIIQILFASFLAYQNFKRRSFFNNSPDLDTKLAIKRSCHLAMKSIFQKRVSIVIFDKNIVKNIEDDNYEFFDFVGGEKIFDIIQNKSHHCTVIITDKLGHRFFTFRFKDSNDKYHFYGRYIDAIEEITHEKLTEE